MYRYMLFAGTKEEMESLLNVRRAEENEDNSGEQQQRGNSGEQQRDEDGEQQRDESGEQQRDNSVEQQRAGTKGENGLKVTHT